MSLARDHLLQIYQAALSAVQGEICTQQALTDYSSTQPVAVIAIGKAASSMMLGAIAALGDAVKAGLLITKEGHCDEQLRARDNIQCLESSHPVLDARSLQAGRFLLSFIDQQPKHFDFILLISGGASSLVEILPDGLTLENLQRVNDWLLGSGWDIASMNHVRKSFSCIKGGRLAQKFEGRNVNCLMISDVLGDCPQTIGSGLMSPEAESVTQFPDVPDWMEVLPKALPSPLGHDVCFDSIKVKVIATIKAAMQAAKKAAMDLGYDVCCHQELMAGDARQEGQRFACELCNGDVALHIWGGETTVQLPDAPGRGGRNQHLALAAAVELSGKQNHYLLAAGTDGSDGPTQDAGALIDGSTVLRGTQAGFDVQKMLASANAGEFLQASGDLISTGPTGTNVMDLVIAIKLPTV